MLSPDPLMGKRGYPLLLASGETADGVDRLVDRQHPHDFFMELSASDLAEHRPEEQRLPLRRRCPASRRSARPPSCTARRSCDSPEAPISHHWLDSTHISFGVLTAGRGARPVQARGQPLQRPRARPAPLEHRDRAAGFDRGAAVVEPDARRCRCRAAGAISRIPSSSSRASTRSAGRPARSGRDEIAPGWKLAGDAGLGPQDRLEGASSDDAYVAEASLKHGRLDRFRPRRDDREPRAGRGRGRAWPGVPGRQGLARRGPRLPGSPTICRWASAGCSPSTSPDGLAPLYGGDNPTGAMGFVRLKLD